MLVLRSFYARLQIVQVVRFLRDRAFPTVLKRNEMPFGKPPKDARKLDSRPICVNSRCNSLKALFLNAKTLKKGGAAIWPQGDGFQAGYEDAVTLNCLESVVSVLAVKAMIQ